MLKISKKEREKILSDKFPEFKKLSDEMNSAITCIIFELEEKLEKLEDIQNKIVEIEDFDNEDEICSSCEKNLSN